MPALNRLSRLRALLAADESVADALLVSDAAGRRYMTGFTGSSGVAWVTAADAALVVDSRYWEQAEEESASAGWRVVRQGREGLAAALVQLVKEAGVRRLGFAAEHVSFAQHEAWRAALPGVELVAVPPLVDRLRQSKDATEVAAIRRAAQLTDDALAAVLPLVRPGAAEADLALEIEFQARRAGAEAAAFPFIVASGPRGSLPHGVASSRRLAAGDMVTFDIGVRWAGYHSDMTRTYAVGEPGVEARAVHRTVLDALDAGLAALRPGARGVDVDAAARARIDAAGHGEHFGHGLGHGVGLAVHEGPRLAATAGDDVVVEGAVVTLEPGIYLPGWGGIRIEDLVVVRSGGPEVLTRSPRDLLVLV
jgi:Xaa-Pro aminopeptidase